MKTKSLFLMLIMCCFALFANAQLEGKMFQTNLGDMGTFKLKFSEKSYELLNPMDDLLVKGNYKIEGDEIFLTDLEGPMACPQSDIGKYKFNLTDGLFKMELIEDNCGGRPNIASGTWKQIKDK